MARYATVGGSAAAVYYLSAIALVELGGLQPLAANPFAFLVAFLANYSGQRAWTFSDSTRPHRSSLPRFLGVAVVSFSLNQTLFYLLLSQTALPYLLSLPIAAGSVALLSFILSLLWAFRNERDAGTQVSSVAAPLQPRSVPVPE
jgi:putative flippase GtrA